MGGVVVANEFQPSRVELVQGRELAVRIPPFFGDRREPGNLGRIRRAAEGMRSLLFHPSRSSTVAVSGGGALAPPPPIEYGYAAFRGQPWRSEEHTSELQSLMRISYAAFCLKK